MSDRLIVFDVSSSFGYFRKSFTTTSALTHAVIPRSAVEGLVGAILGLSRDNYPEKLQSSNIAVEIRSPVRKLHMKYMHTNPDWWQNISFYFQKKTSSKAIQFAVPTAVELLVEPEYRMYIDCHELNPELSMMLKDRKAYYTPYLGTSSMICSAKYVGELEYNVISSSKRDYLPIVSIVPFSNSIPRMKLERDSRFAIEEGLPIHIDNQRSPHGTYKVVYSPEPRSIGIIDDNIIEVVMGETTSYVKFLPTQVTSQ
jgi:CRISPR-associated protein Cas5h